MNPEWEPHRRRCLAVSLGFARYEAAFRENEGRRDRFADPDGRDLKEVGVFPRLKDAARAKNKGKAMKKFIAAVVFAASQWQLANAQTILGSIPEELRGEWCRQENSNDDQIFKSGTCRLKTNSLSIDRMTLERGPLSCIFDSGTTSDGILNMRLNCSGAEEKQPSVYGAQIKLRPDKKIELIMEPVDQQ